MAVLVIFAGGCNQTQQEAPKEKKTAFIILDGISADVLEMVDTPNLDEVIDAGSYSRAYLGGEAGGYSESPTVSAVGYMHVITGVWSNKHNVYGNDVENPNYNYWSIFRLMEEQQPEKTSAIYSSWLDNRTKLVGDSLEATDRLEIDIHYDGFELDTLTFPQDEEGKYVQSIDDTVTQLAGKSIKENGPDLSWVYMWYTDSAGHYYGDGTRYYNAIKKADEQIGRIWDAIQYREANFNEDWLFLVTTDHGRALPDGKGHGGHSKRERTVWVITNQPDNNLYFQAMKPAVVDLFPTMARFMGLELPGQLDKELDGVPLMGDVSVSHPEVELTGNELDIRWKAWQDTGDVKIWLTETNQFAEGGNDDYELVQEAPLIDGHATVNVGNNPSDFYKVVIEAPQNSINRWVVEE